MAASARSRRFCRRERSAARKGGVHLGGGQVRAVRRRARLLPPRVGDWASVKCIEPRVLHELHADLPILLAVGGDGNGDAIRASCRLCFYRKRVGTDRVPRFNDGPPEQLDNPRAFDLTGFDRVDLAVAVGIVVRRIHDDRLDRKLGDQRHHCRQAIQGDREDHDVNILQGLGRRDGACPVGQHVRLDRLRAA